MIATTYFYMVGLKTDRTVIAAGDESHYRKYKYDQWEDVVSVLKAGPGIFGLTSDGTLLTDVQRCTDGRWRDVVTVFYKDHHFYGRKADGTVVSTDRSCDEGMWRDVVAVSKGNSHTVWLKNDGTVAAHCRACWSVTSNKNNVGADF